MDEGFRVAVGSAIARANDTGQDVAEYLHRYGLLATPQWKARVEAKTILKIAQAIEDTELLAHGVSGVQVSASIVRQLRGLAGDKLQEGS